MFKVCLLISLALVGAAVAQPLDLEGPPEPYAYGYETDTHAAAEQKDPSGVVTGYYTLAGDDGRQRRVEYVADAAGFRAKIATNEAGTKSDSPADTELLAAPPTPEQLAQGNIVSAAAPIRTAARSGLAATVGVASSPVYNGWNSNLGYNGLYSNNYNGLYSNSWANGLYGDNRASYGYGNGYYGNGLGYANGLGYSSNLGYANGLGYGNGLGYASGLGYANGLGYSSNLGYANGNGFGYSNYNHHLPASYYRSVGAIAAPSVGNVRAAPLAARAPGIARGAGLGSSNYIVLKK